MVAIGIVLSILALSAQAIDDAANEAEIVVTAKAAERTKFTFRRKEDGRFRCRITRSSGSGIADQATCDAARISNASVPFVVDSFSKCLPDQRRIRIAELVAARSARD